MPFPASLQLITLTGEFLDGEDGLPRAGVGTVTLPTPIRSTGDNVIIPQFTMDFELDSDGQFSIPLPATTDPEWLPNTAVYVIQITFSDFAKLWWSVALPHDSAGATVDLADVGAPNIGVPGNTVLTGASTVTQDGGYRGLWDNGTVYRVGDTTEHDGAAWGALRVSAGVEPGTNGAVWAEYPGGGGQVESVFGRTGAVVAQTGDYTKANVGLANVDNTADIAKPVSTLQAAADAATLTSANAYTDVLGSATTTALAGKANLAGGAAFTGAVLVGGQAVVVTTDGRLSDTRTPTDGSVTTAKIVDGNVTLAKFANIASATILGNNTGGAAAPIALTTAQIKALMGIGTYRGDWDPGATYNPGDTVTYADGWWGAINGASAGQTPWTQKQLYSGVPGSLDTSDGSDYLFRGRVTVARKLRIDGLVWYKAALQTAIPHQLRVYDAVYGTTLILVSGTTIVEGSSDVGYKVAPVLFDMLPGRTYDVGLVTGLTGDVGYHYSSGFSFPVTNGNASLTGGGFVLSHTNISPITNGATHLYAGVNIRFQDPHANWTCLARYESLAVGSNGDVLASLPPFA